MSATPEEVEKLLRDTLMFFRPALMPGRGKKQARFVRKVCRQMGWDEDEFLDRMFVRDKVKWGIGD
jgi:hypothetical protein